MIENKEELTLGCLTTLLEQQQSQENWALKE